MLLSYKVIATPYAFVPRPQQTLTTLIFTRLKLRCFLAQPNRVLAYASEPVCLGPKETHLCSVQYSVSYAFNYTLVTFPL